MRNLKLFLSILFFILGITNTIKAQNHKAFVIPDSLQKMSFKELEKRFDNNISIDSKNFIYANTYYKKSKLQKDKIIIANGMYMVANVIRSADFIKSFQLIDSIIELTKNSNDYKYPAKAYLAKCDFLLRKTHLKEALVNLLEAEKHAKKTANLDQLLLIKRQIALIKIELGNPNDALPLVLEICKFYESKGANSEEYLYSAWLLTDIYNKLKKPNEAIYHLDSMLKELDENNAYYMYLMMYKGISLNLKKQYQKSNEHLDKGIFLLKSSTDRINLSLAYYYRGENVLKSENNLNKAKSYFIKADSLMIITKGYLSDIRPNYVRLIEIAKKQNDNQQQLHYLNRLIEIDQILNKNNHAIAKSINQDYDTPHLLAQKEQVIANMRREKYSTIIIIAICFVVVILLFALYFIKSKKEKEQLEERFKKLMEQTKTDVDETSSSVKPLYEMDDPIKTKSNEVPIEVADMIVKKLVVFVKKKEFLKPNIKQTEFAKQLSTNTTYLSIVINNNMGKNFNQFINDLRIDYTIEQLKVDTTFRKFSIEALAQEVGFGNTQSFSKAFFNKTGLQPSYFIKKLLEGVKV